jgi:hypothetical protein
MAFDSKKPTTEQGAKIQAEKVKLGVKFLPLQALRRIAETGLQPLGASKRRKAAKRASREAALKQALAAKK